MYHRQSSGSVQAQATLICPTPRNPCGRFRHQTLSCSTCVHQVTRAFPIPRKPLRSNCRLSRSAFSRKRQSSTLQTEEKYVHVYVLLKYRVVISVININKC